MIIAMALTTACKTSNFETYNTIVQELSDPKYYGRSDYENGNIKAADYISSYLKDTINQTFYFPMNVFRGNMELIVDDKLMVPCKDYIMKEFSTGINGNFKIVKYDDIYKKDKFFDYFNKNDLRSSFVEIDFDEFYKEMKDGTNDPYLTGFIPLEGKVGGVIFRYKKMPQYFKARAHYLIPFPVVGVGPNFPSDANTLSINFENEYLNNHTAHNIIATIKGKKEGKKIVLTAHYDHLGFMGKDQLFAGANDNASGVATLINLYKYYSKSRNTPENDIIFIFFDGEEANLLGAWHYTKYPIFPLEEIKYLINLDMVGDNGKDLYCEVSDSGEDGFKIFERLIKEKELFNSIIKEPLSDNSDHYPFAIKGVPAIYFTYYGDFYKYYHTPKDVFKNASSENYHKLFNLLTEFIEGYN